MAKGDDQRGRDAGTYQNQRYNDQQGPAATAIAENYGRASETDFNDRNTIMGGYSNILNGGGAGGGGGGGGGASMQASHIGYEDPFESYGGFKEFSQTGGYSAEDMANLRARGISPIRAAYANAQREIDRQRSLQGGYSPNAVAARVKMARDQGQSMSDVTQSVEGGIVDQRNKNKLMGLGGMSNIEGQRLQADLDVSRFNAQADMAASASGASASNAAAANNRNDQFRALSGMTSLYGTTPGMSELFGNQLINVVGQGGNQGIAQLNAQNQNSQLPGNYDYFTDRAADAGNALYPWLQ